MYLEMFTICCEALQTPDNHGALEEYAAWNMMKHLELAASIPVTSNSTAALLEKITAKKCAAMIMSITALANRELAHSQLADSEKLLKEALAFATKRFGEASMEVLVALGRLGNAYVRQERYGDALSLFTEQMNMHEELRRQGHELGIPGLVEAAEVQELGHQLVEGEKLRLRAIEYGQSHGPDLILIAQQQLALALNMEEQEKFDDAYHFFEQCVSSVGRENTDLWFSIREEFALFQERRGQKGVVLAEFEKMYEEQVSISGRQDVKSMIRKWYVACFTMDHEDNWPRSDRLWEEIIAWKTDKEGRNTTSMAALVKSWAWNCKKHERWEKARSIANDALEIARRAYKPGAYAISGHLLILGDIAFGQGRREEGTEYYEEGIKIHADILGNQHPWTLDARESLRMQQAPEGREISRPRRDSIHPYTPRHVRTRREWRSLKNSAERELYCRV
jgi:tetratricopeptide (TPR) repeat protein